MSEAFAKWLPRWPALWNPLDRWMRGGRVVAARVASRLLVHVSPQSPLRGLLTPEQRLRLCRRLIRDGEIGAAVMQLSELLETPRLRPEVEKLIAQCGALRAADGAGSRSKRRLPLGDDRDFQVVPAGSDVTAVAFCAQEGRGAFVDFMNHYFQRLRINAIYVFDARDIYYLGGVRGLGADPAETVAGLRRLAGQLGTRRLMCFGLSAGGYGALRYGPELNADGVLALSPIVAPALDARRQERIAAALGRALDPGETDLARLYSSRLPVPLTRIVFGEENAVDTKAAARLSGVPGVSLERLAGVGGHNTLLELAHSGELAALLERFVEEVRAAPVRNSGDQ